MTHKRSCGNPHCKGQRKLGKLACLPCWRALPEKLQRAIYAAWRARDMDKHSALVLEAREEWAKALPR